MNGSCRSSQTYLVLALLAAATPASTGGEGRGGGEGEDPQVEGHHRRRLIGLGVGRDHVRDDAAAHRPGEEQAEAAGEQCQERVFDHQQAQQVARRGAQGGAERHLILALASGRWRVGARTPDVGPGRRRFHRKTETWLVASS